MGKLRQTALILGEGPTEFFYFKSLCDWPNFISHTFNYITSSRTIQAIYIDLHIHISDDANHLNGSYDIAELVSQIKKI